MWKLGLNKAPVGQRPRERPIPRSELVQLGLRGGSATTHITILNNPEVLHNDNFKQALSKINTLQIN